MDPADHPAYSHSRTRTTSFNIFPPQFQHTPPPNPPQQQYGHHQQQPYQQQQQYQQQQYQQHQQYYPPQMPTHLSQPPMHHHQRRSASVNTFSTVSSGGGMMAPTAYKSSPPGSADIRRSTSSRSGTPNSPQPAASYVALLRKQKATVWCDRAQFEDPRLLAQQRAAKMRAHREVTGSSSSGTLGGGRTATGLSSAGGKVAAKIRHHGKPAVIGYSPGSNLVGVGGVPLRLSATEVEGEDSDEEDQRLHHRRTGSSSGRSSTGSGRRALPYRSSGGLGPSNSGNSGRRWSPGDTPERSGSLVVEEQQQQHAEETVDDAASGKAKSFASGSSAERLDAVPDLSAGSGRLAAKSHQHALTREKSTKNPEDLRRRGSVDERATPLSNAGRLFIANPD